MELIDETPDAKIYRDANGRPIRLLKSLLPPANIPPVNPGISVVPSMMGPSPFAPAPTPPTGGTPEDTHPTPPGYSNAVPNLPGDGPVGGWQLSPDGKYLIGKDAQGNPMSTSLAQGAVDMSKPAAPIAQGTQLELAPDGKTFIGKDSSGEPFQVGIQRAQELASTGQYKLPAGFSPTANGQPVPAPGGAGGPAGILGQFAMGALPPRSGGAPAGADYARAVKQEQAAISEGAKVGMQRAAEQAAYQGHLADQMDALQAQQAAKQGERQRVLDDQARQLQQSMAVFNSEKIDPTRFWASRTTGQKVLAGIGLALGAMGSAFTGGPNQALGIIQSAIDRDIDAQKANLAKAQQGVQNQASLFQIYRQKFQDDAQAEAATRATMLQNAAQRLAAMAAKYDAPQVQAQAKQASAALGAEAAKAMDDFRQRGFENYMQTAQLGLQQEQLGLTALQRQQALNARFVPGLGYALDEKSADELRKRYPAYQTASSLVDELAKLRDSEGAAITSPSAANKMKAIAAKLKFALQQNEGLQRLSDEDVKQLDQVIGGDPTRIGYVLPVLKQLSGQLDDEFRRTASSYLDPNLPNALSRRPALPTAR